MFEKLGKAKYVVPLLIGIVAACVMSVMFYPMANMEMKGLPFAVLSLDEGVETPQGDMNVGDTLVENITSATAAEDGEESPIAWTKVGSQKELDEALENGEYYGAIIVPADFSAQQMAVKQAETKASLAQAQALMAAQAQAEAAAAASSQPAAKLPQVATRLRPWLLPPQAGGCGWRPGCGDGCRRCGAGRGCGGGRARRCGSGRCFGRRRARRRGFRG
ncbi:MAG: YhgE/Pip domain-containing protein [Eggerthella lenta]